MGVSAIVSLKYESLVLRYKMSQMFPKTMPRMPGNQCIFGNEPVMHVIAISKKQKELKDISQLVYFCKSKASFIHSCM